LTSDWERAGFGLYVHWPFCEAKCPYCDFNSHVVRNVDQSKWAAAFKLEMDKAYLKTPNRTLSSIFFGGGTPSLMEPALVEGIIAHAHSLWGFNNNIEITLEANPSSVEIDKFSDFRIAGVNRVSLGVQALLDDDLKRLGRLHSVEDALIAIEIAQNTFDRVSFDLIYGRQNQSLAAWESELSRAIEIGTNHLSLYHLTIEPGTAFGDRYDHGRLRGLPSEDLSVDLLEATKAITGSNGFINYEVSNHAKNDEISIHNMTYWNYGDYVGIGPGAHGRVQIDERKFASETALQPGKWLEQVDSANGSTKWSEITPKDQAYEMVLMGLRTNKGISIELVEDRHQNTLDIKSISELVELDLLKVENDFISATNEGRFVLNSVIEKVIKTTY